MRSAAGICLCFVMLAGARPAAWAGDTVILRRVYAVGEVDRYLTVIRIDGTGTEAEVTTTEATTNLSADGVVTVVTTIDDAKMRISGQETAMAAAGSQTIISLFDKNGRMTAQQSRGPDTGFTVLFSLIRPVISTDRPLKVGEKWTDEITGKDGVQKTTVAVTILAVEPKSADLPTDVIRLRIATDGAVSTPKGLNKLRTEATVRLAADTRKLITLDGVISGLPGASAGAGKVSIKVTRQAAKPPVPK